jgi:hypothetical protein
MVPPLHGELHPPQFKLFVCSSTHPEPHSVSPDGQVQIPLTHVSSANKQEEPHAPQFCAFVRRSIHAPPQTL